MALDEQGNYVATPQPTTTIPAPTAADVYSSDNIAQAVTQPTAKLDLSDPLGIYDYYMKSPEMTAAQAQYQKDLAALGKTKATAASRQLAIEQNPLEGMQYIVGAQSRAGQLDAAQIAALSDALGVSQSALLAAKETAREKANIALEQRNQLTSLITQYPGAKITYYDTMDSAAKKIEKYNKEQEKKAYKDELKKQLISLGKSTKGLSTKELEKKLKKYNKEALAEAKSRSDQEWDMKVAQFNKSMSSGGTTPDLGTFQENDKTYFYNKKTGDVYRPEGIEDTSSLNIPENESLISKGFSAIKNIWTNLWD
jgi:hypothetical protein